MKGYAKYLGVMIDSNLAGKYHTQSYLSQNEKSKTTYNNKNMGIIAQLIRHCVPRHVILSVYNSLIISSLANGICSWGNCVQKFQRKILIPGPCVSLAIACLRNTPYPSLLNRIAFPYVTYFFSEILAIYCMNQLLYRKPSIVEPRI